MAMNRSAFRIRKQLQASLRRPLSSSTPPQSKLRRSAELGLVGAAALFVGAYATWQVTDGKRRILLDAHKQSREPNPVLLREIEL